MAVILVVTNLPDSGSAFNLARHLVQLRLAACVNVLPAMTSFYEWDGKLEEATEQTVVVKTVRARYAEVERAILERHPYELPEILAIDVEDGLPAYLQWVERESAPR
ncbi:MAG TPA: divalent-cation tolerance protein CutA [Usitatibacter sp.]|nr:divalent-cation tolerance protein CutA [Usitatibacter sp.]